MVHFFLLPVQNFDDVAVEMLKTANFDVFFHAVYLFAFAARYNDSNMSVGTLSFFAHGETG